MSFSNASSSELSTLLNGVFQSSWKTKFKAKALCVPVNASFLLLLLFVLLGVGHETSHVWLGLASVYDASPVFDLCLFVLLFLSVFASVVFYDGLTGGPPLFELPVLNLLCAHTRRSARQTSFRDLYTVDGNRRVNIQRLNRFYSSSSNTVILYGVTVYSGVTFRIPVYCDPKTASRVFVAFQRLDNADRRLFLFHGIWSPAVKELFRPLFSPILVDSPLLAGLVHGVDVAASFTSAVYVVMVLALMAWDPLYLLLLSSLVIVSQVFHLTPTNPLYIFCEEFLSDIFGWSGIVIAESCMRLNRGLFPVLLPALVHFSLSFVPFWVRVPVHILYNNFVFHLSTRDFSCSAIELNVLESVENVSYLVDVVNKIRSRDSTGLLLSLGMKASCIPQLREAIRNEVSDDSLVRDILEYLTPECSVFDCDGPPHIFEEDEEIVALGPNAVPAHGALPPKDIPEAPREGASRLLDWLPKKVRKSPTFSKISAFLAMIMFSSRFASFETLQSIGKYFTESDFLETADIMSTIASAFMAVVNGIKRVVTTGSFRDFFESPKEVAFLEEGYSYLHEGDQRDTVETLEAKIGRVQELIESRKLERNSVTVDRMLRELREYVVARKDYIDQWSSRIPPMPVFLYGPPGTGKTTIMDSIESTIATAAGVKRYLGDRIVFQDQNKYPTSIGANRYAHFLVANDTQDDYSESLKQSVLPLDQVYQQVFDTSPLSFNAAAVKDKGKVLNHLLAFITTSNHYQFKMHGETEKLVRRFASGVLVAQLVVNEKGSTVPYSEFSQYSDELRNERTRFLRLEPIAEGRHLAFVPARGATPMTMAEFFRFVRARFLKHREDAQSKARKFADGAIVCPCGAAEQLHLTTWKKGITKVLRPLEDKELMRVFLHLGPMCDPTKSSFTHYEPYVPAPVLGTVAAFEPEHAWALLLAALLWQFGLVAALLGLSCILGVLAVANVKGWLDLVWFVFGSRLVAIEARLARWALESPYAQSTIRAFGAEYSLAITMHHVKAKARFLQMRKWLKDHEIGVVAAAAAILMGAVYVMKPTSKPGVVLEPLAPPVIMGHQVSLDSMSIDSYSREKSFPAPTQRSWSKADQSMRTVVVQTPGVSPADLGLALAANTASVWLILSEGRKPVTILFLTPDMFLLNKHFVMKDGVFVQSNFAVEIDGLTYDFDCRDLLSDGMNELFIVPHHFKRAHKGVLRFLPNTPIAQRCTITHYSDRSPHTVAAEVAPARIDGVVYHSLRWVEQGVSGMCGEPVATVVGSHAVLAGVVSYGVTGQPLTGCTLLSREWVDRALAKRPYPVVEGLVIEFPGKDLNVQPLAINSEFRNVANSSFIPIGTLPGGTAKFKSALQPTPVKSSFESLLSEPFLPPERVKGLVDGEWHSNLINSCKNMSMTCDLTSAETEAANSHYIESAFPKEFITTNKIVLSPLTLHEAVFGCEQLGVARIDFKTSVGAYLRELGISNKYDMFPAVGDERVFHEDVMKRVRELSDDFKRGIVRTPFSDLVNKDELRKKGKIDYCQIRLFCVMDAAWNIFVRMYVMPIITYMLQFPEFSECYGGMNAGSSQWNDLANRLRRGKVPRKYFDADFSSYDFSHDGPVFEAAARAFFLIALRLGYPLPAARIVYLIFASLKWQTCRYMRDVALKLKGMPSGAIITLILNSFINSLLMRVVWFRIFGSLVDFSANFTTSNVGDDNANSIEAAFAERFNMITIEPHYRRLGYIVTPAKKSNAAVATIPFEDLTFLKRSFVWSDELDQIVGPIDKDSIWKSFCYERRDQTSTTEQRLADVAAGAQREAFLHGPQFFCEAQGIISKAFAQAKLTYEVLEYDALKKEYDEGSFRTFML